MRPRSQLGVAALLLASAWLVLDALSVVVPLLRATGPCRPDNEGSWAIGLYHGPSPLELVPFPERQAEAAQAGRRSGPGGGGPTAAAAGPSNPVLTCASISLPPSNFVADPFLWLGSGNGSTGGGPMNGNASSAEMHVFFETKSNTNMQGDIGVARSSDGGANWHFLGLALDEPWHLSYPFVFEWQGQMYLLPEGHASGGLRLYVADRFPLTWRLHSVLLPRPLIDTSLVQWQGRWWMFTSDVHSPFDLELLHATSPLGPWQPHLLSPVQRRGRASGARMGGRLAVHEGRLYRFGQDCEKTYGHQLVAYHVEELSPTAFRESRVPLRFDRQPWSAARHHHLDAQQLPDGSWLAVADGDRQRSAPISGRLISDAAWLVAIWISLLAAWARPRWAACCHQRLRRTDSGGSGGRGKRAAAAAAAPQGLPGRQAGSSGATGSSWGAARGSSSPELGPGTGAAKRQAALLLDKCVVGRTSCILPSTAPGGRVVG